MLLIRPPVTLLTRAPDQTPCGAGASWRTSRAMRALLDFATGRANPISGPMRLIGRHEKLLKAETLSEFETDFLSKRGTGEIADDAAIAGQLAEWEARYS